MEEKVNTRIITPTQKDIPTRPNYRTLSGDILCGNCYNYLGGMYTKFEQVERCPKCDHLIDWSVD